MTTTAELCIAFWDISLANFPDGRYSVQTIAADKAATLINDAKANGKAIFASLEDIGAPYHKHEYDRTRELVEVLSAEYGINVDMRDFFMTPDNDGLTFILPLDVFDIRAERPLLVVTCAYEMDQEFSPDHLRMSVAADTVKFPLFEAV